MDSSRDLEDLLDDLGDLADSPSGKAPREVSRQSTATNHDDDLDDLLGELGDSETGQLSPVRKRAQTRTVPGTSASGTSSGPQKCEPIILAPTSLPYGVSQGVSQVYACDKLRCSSCDFEVTAFEHYTWSPKVDYLFLRNNYPDFERLEPLLQPRTGARAYACQCSSVNATTSKIEVGMNPDVSTKWFCGSHR